MSRKPLNVLFLCTGNSARSIMAEALLNHLGQGRFRAFSAGSRATGRVNPLAIETLAAAGIATAGLSSKTWDGFAGAEAPEMDVVVTVCDNAAGEVCPIWPGHPARVHWGFPDPAAATGTEAERRAAFHRVFSALEAPIRRLVAVPAEDLGGAGVKALLAAMADPPR